MRPRSAMEGPRGAQGPVGQAPGAGVLTLREFSMLISQPSNRKNWAIRTS